MVSCKETSLLLGMCINTPIDGKENVHHHLIFNVKVKLLVLNLKDIACIVKARFSTPPLSSFLFLGQLISVHDILIRNLQSELQVFL